MIAGKELRQRTRDRSAFVIAFLVPFGLAAIFSLTLAKVNEESKFTTTYGVADLDQGAIATAFTGLLRELDFVEVRRATSAEGADRLADDGKVSASFVIPAGFSDSVASGEGGRIRVITNPDETIGPLIARSLAQSFASDLNAIGVSIATVAHAGASPDDIARLQERARSVPSAAVLQQNTAENRLFTQTTFYAIGMAVFFVFFTVEFGVRSLLAERENGTLARLLVAPVRPAWIVAGKSLAAFVVGLVSTVALVLATTLFLDADWGDPLGVAVLLMCGVLAAMGLTSLVATLARTPAQAGAYASLAAVVLGMLGGTFFPTSQGPALLAAVSLVAPQSWLMRGFQDLASGGTLADVWPSIAATLTFAVVLGGIAMVRAKGLVPR